MKQRHILQTLAATIVVVFGSTACSEQPRDISLQLLAAEQRTVDGQMVMTRGVVHVFSDPEHYWIEDDMLNRVAVEPDYLVADMVGERVEVTGRFHADRERGRRIEVTEVRVISEPT